VPLTVAGAPRTAAEEVRAAIVELSGGMVPGARPHASGAVVHVHESSSLEELLRTLAAPPHSLSDDELRNLGVVVVLGRSDPAAEARVETAHYVRPVERDREGHLQRRPPALLSARDAATGVLEHYHWGISTELASRAGMARGAFEQQHEQRTSLLAALAAAGIHEPAAVARAVGSFRLVGTAGDHERH
jgi:hypothetical protein